MTQAYNILIYSISYLLFFALLWLSKEKKGNRLMDQNGPAGNQNMLIVLHIGGILLFGILPCYLLNHQLAVILFGKNVAGDLQITVVGLLVILAVIIGPLLAGKKYREAKAVKPISDSFTTGFIMNYFFVRILFLCGYEIWFRGYLLTDCINSIGIVAAILLNVGLYTLLHVINGRDEVLACIPFGLLLCSLCIWLEAAWPAIVLHIALTVSHEARFVRRINKPSTFFV